VHIQLISRQFSLCGHRTSIFFGYPPKMRPIPGGGTQGPRRTSLDEKIARFYEFSQDF
jgi:hypothetical protein